MIWTTILSSLPVDTIFFPRGGGYHDSTLFWPVTVIWHLDWYLHLVSVCIWYLGYYVCM